MRKYLMLVVMLLGGLSSNVFSQKVWTLEECIQYAVENNLDIQKSAIESAINKESLNQSKRNLLPYVSFSSSGYNSSGKSLDYDTYEYTNTSQIYNSISFSSGIDIFKGFTRQNTIAYRKMSYLAGIEDEKKQKYEVAFSIMEAYYNTVYFHGLMEIVAEQKKLSELNLERSRKQVELGLKAKADLLEMESELAKEELTYVQTSNSYKEALLSLEQAMNINPEPDFTINFSQNDDILQPSQSNSAATIYAEALGFYPTIKAVEMRKEAAEKNLSLTKGALWPTLRAFGGYSTYYSKVQGSTGSQSYGTQLKNNASQYVGLSLDIPVFQKFYYRSEVKLARLDLEKARAEKEKVSQQLLNEITLNYQKLQSYDAEYNQLLKQVDLAQLAYQAAEKKQEQGLISVIELYTSKNALAQAKSDLLRTRLQYIIMHKTIDVYLGKQFPGLGLLK